MKDWQKPGRELNRERMAMLPRALLTRRRLQIAVCDFAPCRTPHTLVGANMGERRIERGDAVRLAAEIRMERDRHDAGGLLAFLV